MSRLAGPCGRLAVMELERDPARPTLIPLRRARSGEIVVEITGLVRSPYCAVIRATHQRQRAPSAMRVDVASWSPPEQHPPSK
jgi:hypothetical protein